jgi:hypothetical protein
MSTVAAATPTPGWSTETVDSVGNVGYQSSIAFSPLTGFPAIGYSDTTNDDLKLATWNGVSWGIQIVDAAPGSSGGISLAFDSAGNPALVYGNPQLKFARWTGASWAIQTIESNANNTPYSELVFKDGQPSIAYGYSTKIKGKVYNQLKLARLVGSSWVSEIVADGVNAGYKSLAYAPDGNPSIAYKVGDTLTFAHKTGSTWAIQSVETGTYFGVFISLAYDPLTGYPTISHGNGSLTNLRFLRWNGSQWNLEIVATGQTTYSSLAYDAAGIAAISYGVSTISCCTNQLWIARRTGCSGTCWVNQLIEDFAPSGIMHRTSLAFAPTGAAAISFGWVSAYPDRDLKFATQVP